MTRSSNAAASGSRPRQSRSSAESNAVGADDVGEWGPSQPGEMDWLEAELARTAPSDMAMGDSFHTQLRQQEQQQQRSSSSSRGGGAAAAIASSKDDMTRLLELRKDINEATRLNIEMQKATAEAVKHTRQAKEELEEIRHALAFAAEAEAADAGLEPLPYKPIARLPFFPALLEAVPFLGRQHQEAVEFRRLTTSNPWLKRESERLKQIVLGACKRSAALHLLKQGCPDPFGKVEELEPHELAEYSLPRENEAEDEDGVDWADIGVKLERDGEDCRTRWLMVDRPGLRNNDAWEQDELIELYSIIEADRTTGEPLDWEHIAERLGTARLGIECLMTYARGEGNPLNRQLDYTLEEDREIVRLLRIWGHWWAMVGERVGTARPMQNFQAHHHANLRAKGQRRVRRWNPEADAALSAVVEKVREEQQEQEQAEEQDGQRGESSAAGAAREQQQQPQRGSDDEGGSNEEDEAAEQDQFEVAAKKIDWKAVAAQLPGQSAYACSRRWVMLERRAGPKRERQKIKDEKQRAKEKAEAGKDLPWTKEEDEMLLKGNPNEGWTNMAARIGGHRPWRLVMKRYFVVRRLGVGAPEIESTSTLRPRIKKKRNFTEPEPGTARKSSRIASRPRPSMREGQGSEAEEEEEEQEEEGTPFDDGNYRDGQE